MNTAPLSTCPNCGATMTLGWLAVWTSQYGSLQWMPEPVDSMFRFGPPDSGVTVINHDSRDAGRDTFLCGECGLVLIPPTA